MSILDTLDQEIMRRKSASSTLEQAIPDLVQAEQQFNSLDQIHRSNEKVSRDALNGIYGEQKFYTGKVPRVYSFSDTEKYPFFAGASDNDCNPYFPITKVQNKTFDGISPLYVSPTGATGSWARDISYSGTLEQPLRSVALPAIQAFPDRSSETGAGSCSNPSFTTQTACTVGGGTWNVSYPTGATATAKLRTAVTPWRDKIQEMLTSMYNQPDNSMYTFWQDILTKLNTILAAVQSDVTYPNITADFAPGSPADIARDYIVANVSSINTQIANRISYLASEAPKQEQLFFGVIKLRLHQANGSFAKLKTIKTQIATNKSLVKDNADAITSLNLLKVKNS
jgi:hypothetical protein